MNICQYWRNAGIKITNYFIKYILRIEKENLFRAIELVSNKKTT